MIARVLHRLRSAAGRPARVARRRASGTFGAFVLMYHRVAEDAVDPWRLCVGPGRFAQHLDVLARRARLMPLRDLARAHAQGALPANAVAITFDDGYADNLHAATPLLRARDVPATVFLTTGYAGHGRAFWWDTLAHTILTPPSLPETMAVDLGGDLFCRALGAAARTAPGSAVRGATPDSPTPREALHLDLWRRLGRLPSAARDEALGRLASWAGVEPERTAPRAMTREEVVELAGTRGVEVGAHTVSHPALPDVPLARQREEIEQSRTDLQALLGRPVDAFSYPHGRHTPETVALVREAGFSVACCSPGDLRAADLTRRPADPWLLPRVYVGDWDGPAFERRLLRGFE